MNVAELEQTATALTLAGKGILAADESAGTIEKRLHAVNVESTGTTRRDYREMLFRAQGIGSYISGIILFDETLRQQAADGTPLVNVVTGQGIIPGIKVDKGAKDLAQAPGEKVTEGLDGLRERLVEYRDLGAKFTKWRAECTGSTVMFQPNTINTLLSNRAIYSCQPIYLSLASVSIVLMRL